MFVRGEASSRIYKLNPDTLQEIKESPKGFYQPLIKIGDDGNIYVMGSNGWVAKLSPNTLKEIGKSTGIYPDFFIEDVSGGYVYLRKPGSNSIIKLDLETLKQVKVSQSKSDEMQEVNFVYSIDTNGNIFKFNGKTLKTVKTTSGRFYQRLFKQKNDDYIYGVSMNRIVKLDAYNLTEKAVSPSCCYSFIMHVNQNYIYARGAGSSHIFRLDVNTLKETLKGPTGYFKSSPLKYYDDYDDE